MTATTTMTIRVPTATKEKLERLASATRRSNSFLAAEAVTAFVERELEIIEGIQEALEDAEAGRTVSHEEAMAEARQIIAEARTRKKRGRA